LVEIQWQNWTERLPIVEVGRAVLVELDHALDDEVWLEPTPGYTAGHVAIRIES
jgi:hypothetical protein